MIRTLCDALVAAAMLSSCSSSSSTPDATSDESATESPSPTGTVSPTYDGPTIPDGTYRRVATLKQWRAIVGGNPPEEWGGKTTLTILLRISGSKWTQLANYYAGPMTPGSFGTLHYDTPGHLIQQETCCDSGFNWTLEGDKLTLTADDTWPDDHEADWSRIMRTGTFTRTD